MECRQAVQENCVFFCVIHDFFGDERVVDSHIKNLRHKLNRDYIETVRGVGYRAAKEGR